MTVAVEKPAIEDHSSKIILERPSEFTALIRFDRPDKKNAFHSSMIVELGRIMAELDDDPAVRCVILTGGESFFAVGADIKEMIAFGPVDVANAPARVNAWRAIEEFRKPVIAAVNGMAFGAGCELALTCDFIVAGTNASFGQPEVKLGGMPGDGGSQRLPRKIPPNIAAYLLMTGDPLDVTRAMQLGLVLEVVEPQDTISRAVAIASTICERSPAALRAIKTCIAAAVGATQENGLRSEREAITKLSGTEDSKEGMRAFAEKRPPRFTGN